MSPTASNPPGTSGGTTTPVTGDTSDPNSAKSTDSNDKSYANAAQTPEIAARARKTAKTYFSKFDFSKNTHSYRISRPPPVGFSDFISNKFKSVRLIDTRMTVILQKFSPTLMMHFDEQATTFTDDFEKAKDFSIKIGQNTISLKAVDLDQTDGHGTIQPRIVKNIFCNNVAPALASNPEILQEALKDYAEIDIDNIDVICTNNIYSGQIVVPVKNYLKIPPRTFEVPYVTHDGKVVPNVLDQITLNCRGVDFNQSALVVEKNKPPTCGYCREVGHWTGQCTKRPRKCSTCGNTGPECSRRNCAFSAKIVSSGEFPARPVRKPPAAVYSDGDESDTYRERESSVSFSTGRPRSNSATSSSSRTVRYAKRKGDRKHRGKPRPETDPNFWMNNPFAANAFGFSLQQLQNISNQNTPLPQRLNSKNYSLSNSYTPLTEIESTSQESVVLNTK